MFSGWVEAWPTMSDTATFTAKKIFQVFVCRYGLPRVIESDRGTHFTGKVFQKMCKMMGIDSKLHTPYYPQESICKPSVAAIRDYSVDMNWVFPVQSLYPLRVVF